MNKLKEKELIGIDRYSFYIIEKYNLNTENIKKIKQIISKLKLNKFEYDYLFYRIRCNIKTNIKLNKISQKLLNDYL